jgi:alpha-D-ribose 1-methylphosphonate 5-triphosphate synthase subunit PhnG
MSDEGEYLNAITEILTVFDDDPLMTEELLAIADDQHTAESAALVRIREIGRRVMEGRGTASGETAEGDIRESRRYLAAAEELAGATGYDWVARRTNDLQAAQVHATLAQTMKAGEMLPLMTRLAEWVASGCPGEVPEATCGH